MKYIIQTRTGEVFDSEYGWAPDAPSDKHPERKRGYMTFSTREEAEKFMVVTFSADTLHTMKVVQTDGLRQP